MPPALILRRDVEPRRRARRAAGPRLPIALGLAALALWQAGSWKLGGIFAGAFAAGSCSSARRAPASPGRAGARAGCRARRGHRLAAGPGQSRPPRQPRRRVLVSLGLARDAHRRRRAARAEPAPRSSCTGRTERAPAFFFIDVQPDQAAAFSADGRAGHRRRAAGADPRRPRAAGRDRRRADRSRTRGRRERRSGCLTREYVLTWAGASRRGRDTVVAGRWWTAEEAARAPLSEP